MSGEPLNREATVKRATVAIALLAFVVTSACGGGSDGNPTGPGGTTASGDGAVTATINGSAWRSAKSADHVTRSGTIYAVGAVNLPYVLVLGIANVTGPGTFSLAIGSSNGSSAIVSNSTGGWGTAFAGGSGTIVVTVLTANRIAGTFSFDAVPGSGSATGTLQVRNGTFDLTF
jgi:hypothetical protein